MVGKRRGRKPKHLSTLTTFDEDALLSSPPAKRRVRAQSSEKETESRSCNKDLAEVTDDFRASFSKETTMEDGECSPSPNNGSQMDQAEHAHEKDCPILALKREQEEETEPQRNTEEEQGPNSLNSLSALASPGPGRSLPPPLQASTPLPKVPSLSQVKNEHEVGGAEITDEAEFNAISEIITADREEPEETTAPSDDRSLLLGPDATDTGVLADSSSMGGQERSPSNNQSAEGGGDMFHFYVPQPDENNGGSGENPDDAVFREEGAGEVSTPRKQLPTNEDVECSPLFIRVRFDAPSDERASKGYRLRSRNLFSRGVSIKRYDPNSHESSASGDNEDDVLFFLDESDDDQDIPRKRSSYSGIRGPKADAKALSLVTNCPVSVKWLVDNFEYCPGKSLPRGFVYDQYVLLCDENGLEPVNAASFGKLIRSVFPGLKTRRLGTRGNSKYHYNGVYLKSTSPLKSILNLVRTQQGLTYDSNGRRGRRIRKCFEADAAKEIMGLEGEEFVDCSPDDYLGTLPEMEGSLGELTIDPLSLPTGIICENIEIFESLYNMHCQALLRAFSKFELRNIFDEWKRFWRIKCNEPVGLDVINYKQAMSKATLFKVCSLEDVQKFIKTMDLSTYQIFMDMLYPSLSKGMPVTMVNSMRNFIKDLEWVFIRILNGYPKKMAQIKIRCLRTFISMWNDYSRLNRMLKAAVSTIRSEDNVQAMKSELIRSINFAEIESEIEFCIKPSNILLLNQLILAFRNNLSDTSNYSVRSWINWADQVVDSLLRESKRQVAEGETSKAINPFAFWRSASDRIMGAMVKGNAVSFGVFKGFLMWCDTLIRHLTKINLARTEGYNSPIFYYESILEKNDAEHKFLESRCSTSVPAAFTKPRQRLIETPRVRPGVSIRPMSLNYALAKSLKASELANAFKRPGQQDSGIGTSSSGCAADTNSNLLSSFISQAYQEFNGINSNGSVDSGPIPSTSSMQPKPSTSAQAMAEQMRMDMEPISSPAPPPPILEPEAPLDPPEKGPSSDGDNSVFFFDSCGGMQSEMEAFITSTPANDISLDNLSLVTGPPSLK